jgi:hypothetical protein
LKEAFKEFEWIEENIQITISNSSPYFELQSKNKTTELKISLKNNSDYFYSFESENPQVVRYNYKQLQNIIKIISTNSEKINLKMNTEGILCIQFEIKTQQSSAFIEYYLLADNYVIQTEEVDEEVIEE